MGGEPVVGGCWAVSSWRCAARDVHGRGAARVRLGRRVSQTGSRPSSPEEEASATTHVTARAPEPCSPTGIESPKEASAVACRSASTSTMPPRTRSPTFLPHVTAPKGGVPANHGMHVAAEKAPILRVKVPPCQWPDSDTSRYHSSWWVTTRPLRGVYGPAAQKPSRFCGRSNLGASRVGEPDHHGRTAAPTCVRH